MSKRLKFSQDFLGQLRRKVDLVALIGEQVELRRSGGKYTGRCPFHEDRRPSFQVDPAEGFYKCWGCGKTGDAVQWIREQTDASFPDAVAQLAKQAALALPEDKYVQERESRQHLAPLYQALSEAQRTYRRGLPKQPKAESFLREERELTQESIQKFELGATDRGITHLLRKPSQTLIDAGLAVKDNQGHIYDRFRNRVMFPIRNERGYLISFAGRALLDADHIPKYLNGPETKLFHKEQELYGLHLAKAQIRKEQLAVVVEGYFDVIQAHQAGDTRVVALMGTTVSPTQMRHLLMLADEIIFVFDGDMAGRKASLAAAWVFLGVMKDGKLARFVFMPDGHDPDSYLRSHDLAAWHELLAVAQPLSQVLATYVNPGLDMTLPENQVNAVGKAMSCMKLITQAPMYAKALCAHLERVIQLPLTLEQSPMQEQATSIPAPGP